MEQEIKEPTFDMKIGGNGNDVLIVTCGKCSTITEIPAEKAHPGNMVKCTGCDITFRLNGDSLSSIKDIANDTLERAFGKNLLK